MLLCQLFILLGMVPIAWLTVSLKVGLCCNVLRLPILSLHLTVPLQVFFFNPTSSSLSHLFSLMPALSHF